jgi:hypothetical protein
MRIETIQTLEAITPGHDSLESCRMPGSSGLMLIDDAALLSERAPISEALEHEPAKKAELAMLYDLLTAELDQRAAQVWANNYEPRQESEQVNRAPADMSTWELIATYRHAWTLAYYRPRGYLAKALANWLSTTQRELESRGAWVAEIMPPHSM